MNDSVKSLRNLKSSLQEKELIKALLNFSWKENFSLALWQSPNTSNKKLVIDVSGEIQFNGELENMPTGFLFAPYKQSEKTHFIKGDIIYSTDKNNLKITNPSLDEGNLDNLEKYLNQELAPYFEKNNQTDDYDSKKSYLDFIEESIQKIKQGDFIKVVPARTKDFELHDKFNILDAFTKLCNQYPNAFVSMVSIPSVGTWLGATPELLISTDSNNKFVTVSLAGTQPYNPETELHDMPWTQKEIEEQAIVSRYIINCFKTIRLREFEETGPKTVKAGNLVHLKSTFEVDMKLTNFINLGSVMLNLLHPTSAVCGMPKESSQKYLEEKENFKRKYFSGFLGPVNHNHGTELFVNLRCMSLNESSATLYAGAGVTAFSEPEKEWNETEIKFRTLLDILETL